MNWTDKYAPKDAADVVGQDEAMKSLASYLKSFRRGRAVLLYGPVGSGKTSSVYAVAKGLGREVFEVNASDARNKAAMEGVVGSAVKQHSLFSFGKIILIDEVDGISGQEDRGGVASLIALIECSGFPIVITANDPYSEKLSQLRKKCVMVEFKPLDYSSVLKKLKAVCESENILYKEDLLRDLSRRCGGDMRAAITDLQLLSAEGRLDNLDLIGERSRAESVSAALLKVFKTTNCDIAKDAFVNVDEDAGRLMLWLEENIPKEYEGGDLAGAFEALSRADVFLGRIRNNQHWRFLVYADALMSAGVALSKKVRYAKQVKYVPSSRILKLWIAKMKYQKRNEIAEKIALKCHSSKKRVIQEILPFVRQMVRNGCRSVAKELCLSDEEVGWLAS